MRSLFHPKCEPKFWRISALPPLIKFQGRNPSNFWLAFWEKQWPHKFILNLTDLYMDSWFFENSFAIFYCAHLRVVPVTLHCLLYFSAPLNSEMHSWRRFDKLFVIRCVEWAFHLLWLLIQLKLSLAVALVVTTTEGMFPTIKEVRWIINPVVTWCILT